MALAAGTRAFVLELFEELGGVTARPMMGGLAVYRDGRVFAIVPGDERIYLKAKGPFAAELAEAGAVQFAYLRAGRPARMGYWSLPDDALDDAEAACDWARRALAQGT